MVTLYNILAFGQNEIQSWPRLGWTGSKLIDNKQGMRDELQASFVLMIDLSFSLVVQISHCYQLFPAINPARPWTKYLNPSKRQGHESFS